MVFCPRRFPFDTNNPIGYALAAYFQHFAFKCMMSFVAAVLLVLIAIFFIAMALTDDIKNDLRLWNDCAKLKKNRLRAVKRLSKFIEFHSTARQLSKL